MPRQYAEAYARYEWEHLDRGLVDRLDRYVGGMDGKRVLDLGAGPGQFTVELARRGARVTWHDVSANYLRIARRQAGAAGVEVEFSLGYLEDAWKFVARPFDLIFCRLCWYYGRSDAGFAKLLYALLVDGGAAYIDTNTREFERVRGWRRRVAYLLNDHLRIKVGHPYPPRERVERLLRALGAVAIETDDSSPTNVRVLFKRPGVGG